MNLEKLRGEAEKRGDLVEARRLERVMARLDEYRKGYGANQRKFGDGQ